MKRLRGDQSRIWLIISSISCFIAASSAGCAELLGIEAGELGSPADAGVTDRPEPGADAGLLCDPGEERPCYGGPPATEDVGNCKGGAQRCLDDGSGFGACEDQVLPSPEVADPAADHDCDGFRFAEPRWCIAPGELGTQAVTSVAVDAAGGLVAIGLFDNTIDFGGGPMSSPDQVSFFVAKLDADGGLVWSKQLGGAVWESSFRAAVDAWGNVLLAGTYSGAIDLGDGSQTSAGDDAFIAKLGPGGEHLWSRTFGGALAQSAEGIGVDMEGNVVVAGSFRGETDIGDAKLTSNGGSYDVFVASFDMAGDLRWARSFGDAADQYGTGISVAADGSFAITGLFSGSIDVGGEPLTTAGTDVFAARFDACAQPLWSATYSGPSDQALSVATAADGRVVVASYFVSMRGADGEVLWEQPLGEASSLSVTGVAFDGAGDVSVAGYFQDAASFGPVQKVAQGGYDIFLAKLTSDGAFRWGERYGDEPSQKALAIAMQSYDGGSVILSGVYAGSVDFGASKITASGDWDAFLCSLEM